MKGYGEAGFDHAGRVVCGECSAQVDNAGKCKCADPTEPIRLPLRVVVAVPVDTPSVETRPIAYESALRELGRQPVECELVGEQMRPEYGDTIKFYTWGFA